MIVRIVKMQFRENAVKDFLQLFSESKSKIGNFEGVKKLQLLQTAGDKRNIFFTYSYWESEEALEKYRNSKLFKGIWKQTKALFEERAEAWSTTIANEFEPV